MCFLLQEYLRSESTPQLLCRSGFYTRHLGVNAFGIGIPTCLLKKDLQAL